MTYEFPISLDIYNAASITQAAKDFSDIADIRLDWDKLVFSNIEQDFAQELFWEFMNYILSL